MLIPAEERAQFNAWSSFCTSGAFIIGPALAGILLTTHSASFVIYCNSLSFLLSTILIYFLPNITLQTKQSEEVANTFVQTLRSDWKQVFHSLELKRTLFSYSFYFKRLCLSLWHLIHKKLFYKTSTVLTDIEYSMLVSITGAAYVSGSFLVSLCQTFTNSILYRIRDNFHSNRLCNFRLFKFIYRRGRRFHFTWHFFIICWYWLFTFYQNNIPVHMIGRIDSVFDSIKVLSKSFHFSNWSIRTISFRSNDCNK